jgi:hypothetical protein
MNNADDIPQSERRRILAEERRLRTYHGQAQASIDDERGGRFAYSGNTTTVTGASPVSYPAQPAGSPWHHDPIGTEPPLGYSVDEQEPVGEPFEVAASTTGERGSTSTPVSEGPAMSTHADDAGVRRAVSPPGFRRRL